MIESDDTAETKRGRVNNKSISVHRAFAYGACAPGLGEIYAGSKIRGSLTASLFIFLSACFIWTSIDIVAWILDLFLKTLKGIKPPVLADLPFHYLIVSFLGTYYIWLWAMISSVDLAMERRRKGNEPSQANMVWGVAISWFCPGSGQVYTGFRRLGYMLFVGYLLGILSTLPVYVHIFHHISLLAKKGQLSTNNLYELVDMINGYVAKVNYSFGNLFQMLVKYFAIANTVKALKHRILHADAKWMKSSVTYGAALLGIGWLCPGSGQLLQGRDHTGWYFFVGYVSSVLLTGLALGAHFITAKGADTLSWICVLIQWAAMIEAPFWMIKHE
jgi:hypothetical protein